MANKKYRPALFELLQKGNKQTPHSTLETPKRFYGRRKGKLSGTGSTEPETPTSEAQPPEHEGQKTAHSFQWPAEQTDSAGRIHLSISYWMAALAVLAIIVANICYFISLKREDEERRKA